jgi:dolichol-phosphate mannosyltransferase
MDRTAWRTSSPPPGRAQLSVITPAYREEKNLPVLYQRLRNVLAGIGMDWEWIIVDDHSDDGTYAVAAALAAQDEHVGALRLSRNFGSHMAVICGLDGAAGDCAVIMAADLQDPPELIPDLLEPWRAGHHIVWAVRAGREGEDRGTLAFSRLYYWLLRRVVRLPGIPATGADFFLIDRKVMEVVRALKERNASLLALIAWAGFTQTTITYQKQARLHGNSGWTLAKKIKMVIDSIASFSFLPIRAISGLGLIIAACGFFYAMAVIVNSILGRPIQGWSSLMVAVLILGGSQIVMIGVLGEYIWRTLDEIRRRPKYIIEASTKAPGSSTDTGSVLGNVGVWQHDKGERRVQKG